MVSVITGDIINSRKALAPAEYLLAIKKEFVKHGESPKSWEVFRGDSFQLEVFNPIYALETAIKLKAIVKQHKGLDVRMAIGIGTKDYEADCITESNGEAFVFSGTTLDFKLDKEFNLAIKSKWNDFDHKMNLLIKLVLSFMNNWTEKTAQAIELVFNNPGKSQKQLAEILNIGQSTISERLDRGKINLVYEVIDEYKNDLTKLLNP